MLARLLSRLEPVHVARSEAERAGIYRFRYRVYIEELKYDYPADHERRWLKQEQDERPQTTLLYTGSPEEVTSTVRIRAFRPGTVEPKDFHTLSLERFPGIERLGVAQIGRLMIRPTLRGKLLLPSLLRAGYELLAGELQIDLAFLDCLPGIVRYYRQLGARPYGGRLIDLGYGQGVPLVIVLSDYEHLRRSGSVVAPLARKYFGPGKRAPLDTSAFRHVLEGDALPVEFDPEKVWREIQERLLAGAHVPSFAEMLPARVLKTLAGSGFLLTVAAGDVVARQGTSEREMFVILEGAFEVLVDERQVALLEKGDLFGEIAFFSEAGERTASVRALTEARLLVLRRKFLEELTQKEPGAGFQVLMNLSRIMAERLSGVLRATAGATADPEE